MERVTIIRCGEVRVGFAGGGLAAAYDVDPARRQCIAAHNDPEAALLSVTSVLSLVTADCAHEAARSYAPMLAPATLWCDFHSLAPETKRVAAGAMAHNGARHRDVAAIAPVYPSRLAVPLLVSRPDVDVGAVRLKAAGFRRVRAVVGDVSRASLGDDYATTADYEINRMPVDGTRRVAEMREVAKTPEGLGIEPVMTRGTIRRQAEVRVVGAGSLEGLTAKLRLAA